jgi:hypothetical protein
MRRFAIALGLTAALAVAAAAPASAHKITPASADFGQVDPGETLPLKEFELEAEGTTLNGEPTVVSGDSAQFTVLAGFCDGSLLANDVCTFRVRMNPKTGGATSAVVGVAGGPTATVTAIVSGPGPGPGPGSGSGKKKSCKKKGKKGAAAAKKKKCGKKKKK